jgi:hypothetical protein
MAIAAPTRAAGGAFALVMTSESVWIASGASGLASAFASARAWRTGGGNFGLPPGLPLWPGLKLVDRLPPRGMVASLRLFFCLLAAFNSLTSGPYDILPIGRRPAVRLRRRGHIEHVEKLAGIIQQRDCAMSAGVDSERISPHRRGLSMGYAR